ncbi:FAD:protein FMN transferase [Edaphobacter bradus]|uniref:FAD:protein FMN transferase n=1 Tax=Edaphobacter bradus TaxID=2259016 RepID=UPI0021E08A31|nr:FAD:protein FMN transferase [Edaphobacter bradus]
MALLAGFAAVCQGVGVAQAGPLALYHEVHQAMGSEFTIDLYAPDQESAERSLELAFEEVDRIEDLLSNYRPTSELSRISREAGAAPVTTDPETFSFIERAVEASKRSDGAFDITVGPLMRAWGFFFNKGRIPSADELSALRKKTGWRYIQLDASRRTVFFTNHVNMELDPGSIGKGYAVDRVVELLRQQGISAALISAGSSSIYGLGSPPGADGWPVNVPDPAHAGRVLSKVVLKDLSLSTGACTEKFFIKNGHRYCHILSPRTMSPVEGMLQTTVLSPSATDSDALSTATFVLGKAGFKSVLQAYPHSSGLIVSGTPRSPAYSMFQWPQPVKLSQSKKEGDRAR